MNLAIIPARSGSKRIKNKNIKNFLGKPILLYSIDLIKKIKLFDHIIVSTDSNEIIKLSERNGVKIPFKRSKKNSSDHATTSDVILEVLKKYKSKNIFFDYLCVIYPTAPFITKEVLNKGYYMIKDGKCDSVFPAVKFDHPISRGFKLDSSKVNILWKDKLDKRSQDFDDIYHDAGQFYWINVNSFMKSKKIITNNSMCIKQSRIEVHDIDNLTDWNLAEIKYEYLRSIKKSNFSERKS